MSGTSSVPLPTLGPNGYLIPPEPEILAGTQADMNAAFGGNLNPALETPQGQLATTQAAIIGDEYAQFLQLTNNVDPAYSTGRMQDAIARIYFLERLPALPTSVIATCSGLVGVPIPVGALARAQSGVTYACTQAGVIGVDGTVDLTFAATVDGPIACPATTLDQVFQTIPGWEAITNATDGAIGRNTETRADFEARRAASVAKNSIATVSSILGSVLEVPDVLDAFVTENFTGTPVVLDGVTLPAHSVYVCVAGGAAADVARAIWQKKPPGCDMAGDTTIAVEDQNSGYVPPYPTYDITFQIAETQTLIAWVQIYDTPQVPSNALGLIRAAMLAAFTGADGGVRARIGTTWFASRFYPAVMALGSWVNLIQIGMGSSAVPAASFTASIATTVLTVTVVGSGTLAVGQTVVGAGIPDGVRIVSLGTGAGGTGTYNLNLPQTISSESMTSINPFAGDTVVIGQAHVPALSAENIVLQLV